MKLLVVGSGGREHAIIKALAKSPKAEKIYVLPGNPGIAQDVSVVENVNIGAKDIDGIVKFAVDNKIEFAVTNKSLVNMYSLMKSLTYYESATSANLVLLFRLKQDANKLSFNEEELDFLENITVENKQCDNLSKIYAGILSRMSEARVSVVSNNLAVIMKYLAIINVIFMPLTVITGLGGMSEFTMMTNGIWWPHAYSALVLVMVIIGYITYLILKKIEQVGTRKR